MKKIKIPFLGRGGRERSAPELARPTVVSPEEASRESTLQFLAGDSTRLPTEEDVLAELVGLPMFSGLDSKRREDYAKLVMTKRQQKENPS